MTSPPRPGLYRLWLALAALDLLGAACSPARIAPGFLAETWLPTAVVAAAGIGLLRLGALRAGRTALALARVWAAILLLLCGAAYVTPWTSATLADPWLSWPDRGAAVVWSAGWLQTHGWWPLACAGYLSHLLALQVAVGGLVLAGRIERIERLSDAFVLASVVGLLVYVLAPAAGPLDHGVYLAHAAGACPAWWALRAGERVELSGTYGFLSVPSFHAVSAQLLIRAVWPWRSCRPVAVVWWAILVGTAIPVGAHYWIDLVVGIGLAEAAWRGTR